MTERTLPTSAPETLDRPAMADRIFPPLSRPQERRARASAPLRRRWLRFGIALAGAVALCAWLVLVAIHSNSALVNSDGATVVLQGQALAHGNVLLEGWHLSLDSWWTLDVPFYAIATAVAGVRPADLLVVPAVIAALLVVLAVVLVRGGRSGRAAFGGAAVVVAVLAFPSHMLAYMLLAGPVHQSTVLFSLVAFAGLRRNRLGPGFVVAVLALAAGLLGDLQTLTYAVLPIFASGIVAMLRKRSARPGAVPLAAAGASAALALAVRAGVDRFGGFEIGPANHLATAHQVLSNLAALPQTLGGLLGVVTGPYGSGGVPEPLLAVHVASATLLGACLVLVAVRLVRALVREAGTGAASPAESRAPAGGGAGLPGGGASPAEAEPWRLDDILLFAALGSVGTFVMLARDSNPHFARYLTAAVVVSAILAGREVARRLAVRDAAVRVVPLQSSGRDAARRQPPTEVPPSRLRQRGRRIARPVLALGVLPVVACFAAGSAIQLNQPVPPQTASGLASFLERHHLDLGIGDFWLASITTVESDGRVLVRPVVPAPDGVPEAYNKGEVPGWFAGVPFRFLVVTTGDAGTADEAMERGAVRDWGEPARRYRLEEGIIVLVWSHPFEVSLIQPPV